MLADTFFLLMTLFLLLNNQNALLSMMGLIRPMKMHKKG